MGGFPIFEDSGVFFFFFSKLIGEQNSKSPRSLTSIKYESLCFFTCITGGITGKKHCIIKALYGM